MRYAKTVVIMAVGIGLYYLLGRFAAIPGLVPGTFLTMQFAVLAVLAALSGSVTGGSPEGAVKALVTKYSDDEKKLYEAIKNAFDPQHILNPNLKLGATPRAVVRRLRTANNSSIQLA